MKYGLKTLVLALAAFVLDLPLVAQNIIVDGEFNQGIGSYYVTQYSPKPSGNMDAGEYCIDNNCQSHNTSGLGWPSVPGVSGNYMIFNGFGNTSSTPKIAWKQTVNVTSQTNYTFLCQLVNLAQGVLFVDPIPAIIQLKINGVNVGDPMTLNASNHNWQPMVRSWNSGDYYGPVEIAIYDTYLGNPGLGDDFGLDQIAFIPDVVYNVAVSNDTGGPVCPNQSVTIDVLANDYFEPNANDAVVTIATNAGHGTAIVLPSKEIQYTYTDEDYTGTTDQFQYRVNNHGVIREAWVTVTLNRAPSVGEIASPDGICAGESFDLTVPSIDDNGSTVSEQGWEIAPTITGQFVPLVNNDIPFGYNGYYIHYKAVNNCGTSYSDPVPVTVYSTEPTFDTIMACDAYPWHNGIVCDHSDDYSTQVTTDDNCEITAHLHFILNEDYYLESQTEASCDEFLWYKTGLTYYDSGVYNDTVDNPNPIECDSIYTLYLTINHAPEIQEDIVAPADICAGDTLWVTQPQYAMNHADGGTWQWEYAVSEEGPFSPFAPENNGLGEGDYFLRFLVANGCSSDSSNVVAFRVNAAPVIHGTLSGQTVCEGFPLDLPELEVEWNNVDESDRYTQWQMSPDGSEFYYFPPSMLMQSSLDGYQLRFVAGNSCGESQLGPVSISVLTVADVWDTIPACDFYVLPSGETITTSQEFEYLLEEPCPHVLHSYVSIHYSDTVLDQHTSCHEEFVWHGQTFFRSDGPQIAYWDTINAYGCNRVMELHLDFADYEAITEYRLACNEYVWPRNGLHYTESQIDSCFIHSTDPEVCDSVIYLNLTLGHDYNGEGETWTECAGFEWNGVVYYADDLVYEYLQTEVTGCDSIVSHPLSIIQPTDTLVDLVSCKPVLWDGHLFEVDGEEYTFTYTSHQGCDSIVTVHFSQAEEILVHIDTAACAPFPWYGNWCYEDGHVYQHTIHSQHSCDTTVFLHLTLHNEVINNIIMRVCDSITYHGVFYGPGTYSIDGDTMVGPNGCDSINRIQLTVTNSSSMCQIHGDSLVYVATNMLSGIYRYAIDTTGIIGVVNWTLSNPEWLILDSDATSCRILVPTPGVSQLRANFRIDCGDMERVFNIRAGFFDLDEGQSLAVKVFPNPTSGKFTVEAEGLESVRVVDVLGQTLRREDGQGSDSLTLDLTGFAPSVYLLEVQTDRGRAMRRIVLCK
jgi:hypothetical protein